MATNLQAGSEPSLTSLVSGIVGDFQELIKQQLALFKAELSADFRKTREASALLVVGGVGLFFGCGLLCLTAVNLLEWAFRPQLELWACYLIVCGVVSTVGASLAAVGWKQFHSFNQHPNPVVEAMKENLEWKTKPN